MPFPLAHPAAVLPLRRLCPRFLNFPALLTGSLTPDIGYAIGLGDISHEVIKGTFIFGLPVGLVVLALAYWLRFKLVLFLPRAPRSALRPLIKSRSHSLRISVALVVFSLMLGIWSHLLLDSICHWDGFIATHVPILQANLRLGHLHYMRGYEFCYMACTFFGVVWLALAYVQWLQRACGFLSRGRLIAARAWSVVLGGIILGVAHYGRGADTPFGVALSGSITGGALIGFIYATGSWCKPVAQTPSR